MHDLRAVEELGADVPLPDHTDLAPARARFMAGIATPAKSRTRLRFAIGGASTVGLAAGIAAVLIIGQSTGVTGTAPEASAAEILHNAAQAALAQPDLTPRPDQFVYIDTATTTQWPQSDHPKKTDMRAWVSVDGKHEGANHVSGDESGLNIKNKWLSCWAPRPRQNESKPGTCSALLGFDPDLPTDADAMLAYLDKNTPGNMDNHDSRVRYGIFALLSNTYLRPAAAAALYNAAAKLPGAEVVKDIVDATGRHGVGLSWPVNAGTTLATDTLIFDPTTFAYLGSGIDGTGSSYRSAVLKIAIVDKVDQEP